MKLQLTTWEMLCVTFCESMIMTSASDNDTNHELNYYAQGALLLTYFDEHMNKDSLLLSEVIDTAIPVMRKALDNADYMASIGVNLHVALLEMIKASAGSFDLLKAFKEDNADNIFSQFINSEEFNLDEE